MGGTGHDGRCRAILLVVDETFLIFDEQFLPSGATMRGCLARFNAEYIALIIMGEVYAEITTATAIVNDLNKVQIEAREREERPSQEYRIDTGHVRDVIDDGCENVHFMFFLLTHKRSIGILVGFSRLPIVRLQDFLLESIVRVRH